MNKLWPKGAMIFCLSILTIFSLHALSSKQDSVEQEDPLFDDMLMDHSAKQKTTSPPASIDDELKQEFKKVYHATKFKQRRAVFEKYFDILGSQGILDFLEKTHPLCHGQSHQLGQVIFVHVKDLGLALKECGTRCTSGCMHGVLKEAFGGNLHADVTNELASLCDKDEMLEIHEPASCAHGVGHAFMMISDYDLEKALSACKSLQNPAMGYYCATGIYMEYFMSRKKRESGVTPQLRNLHFPCDTYTDFPAACYRYQALYISRAFGKSWTRVAVECLKLPRPRRLGCFHGLGKLKIKSISNNPSFLSEVCGRGTPDDQAMCIEGAIERLAEHNEQQALAACTSLDGKNAIVCQRAAKEKMHSLNKPTMSLYYEQ